MSMHNGIIQYSNIGGIETMAQTIALDMNQYELPECEKVTKVFERLVNINSALTQNGVKEVYTERHDQYEESYSIGF